MADLTKEYTDMKDIKHKVEHFTIPADDRNSTEQIMEELLQFMKKYSIYGLGRWGEHQHYNSDVVVKLAMDMANEFTCK